MAAIILPIIPIIVTISVFAVDIQKEPVNSTSKLSLLSGGLGYSPDRFPQFICPGTNGDLYFYSQAIPFCTVLALGLSLLVIIFCSVRNIQMRKEVKV